MENMIMTIDVVLDDMIEVHGSNGEAAMILFHGKSESDFFKGEILPGGVDTQKQIKGESRLMSARYILEGVDSDGSKCRIFIENNGEIKDPVQGEVIKTKPVIYTDSTALKWLETASIFGTVEGNEKGVTISFFKE